MNATDHLQESRRAGRYFLGGGLIAAFAASLCCVGPLLAAGLGLGAFTAAGFFHTLRPVFLSLALLLVAGAWIWDWRKRRDAACSVKPGGEACETGCGKDSRILLAILSAIALALAFSPYLLDRVARPTTGEAPAGVPSVGEPIMVYARADLPTPLETVESWRPQKS